MVEKLPYLFYMVVFLSISTIYKSMVVLNEANNLTYLYVGTSSGTFKTINSFNGYSKRLFNPGRHIHNSLLQQIHDSLILGIRLC
jgi:hypothetical protein